MLEQSGTSIVGMEQDGQVIAMVMLFTGDARGLVGCIAKLGFSVDKKHGLVVRI